MQEHYELLTSYSEFLSRKNSPSYIPSNDDIVLANQIQAICLSNNNVKTLVEFLEKHPNEVVRQKMIDKNAKPVDNKKQETVMEHAIVSPITNNEVKPVAVIEPIESELKSFSDSVSYNELSMENGLIFIGENDFDLEFDANGEVQIIVQASDETRKANIISKLGKVKSYYETPEMIETLPVNEKEYYRNLVQMYIRKKEQKEASLVSGYVKQKLPNEKGRISGFIDALMLGWFTGLVGSITFAAMLYVISK